jgi:hypothetical protein
VEAPAPGTKYLPLFDYLTDKPRETRQVLLSYKDVGAILGDTLPPSAYDWEPWWANDKTHTQARAWMSAGWRTIQVSQHHSGREVVFERS